MISPPPVRPCSCVRVERKLRLEQRLAQQRINLGPLVDRHDVVGSGPGRRRGSRHSSRRLQSRWSTWSAGRLPGSARRSAPRTGRPLTGCPCRTSLIHCHCRSRLTLPCGAAFLPAPVDCMKILVTQGAPAMIDNPPPSPPSPEPLLSLKRQANPDKETIPQESKPEHPKGRARRMFEHA